MLIDLDPNVPPPDPARRPHRAVALADLIAEFRHFGFRGGAEAFRDAVDDLEDAGAVVVERVGDETWLTWVGGPIEGWK